METIIYTQNENYTIWTDDNYLCYIQMTGGEIESKAYDIASEAIEEAEGRIWVTALNANKTQL